MVVVVAAVAAAGEVKLRWRGSEKKAQGTVILRVVGNVQPTPVALAL